MKEKYLLRDFESTTEEGLDEFIIRTLDFASRRRQSYIEDIDKAENIEDLKSVLKRFITNSIDNMFECQSMDNKHALILSEIRDLLIINGIFQK